MTQARTASETVVEGQAPKARVLLIEDDPDMQVLVEASLPAGWELVAASTGREGLAAAFVADPDVIVLDLGLPDLDGEQVLGALRADPELAWRPVVILSASLDETRMVETLAAGTQDVVAKPFRTALLAARLVAAHRVATGHRAALAATQAYQSLADSATDVVVLARLDGTISYVSPSIEAVLGFDPAKAVGRQANRFLHPDDQNMGGGSFAALVEGREEIQELRYRIRHRDGSWRWCDCTRRLVADPATGEPEIRSSIRDVTEEVLAQEAVAAMEEMFRLTFDDAPIGIALAAPDGGFERVNLALCDMLGYERDELQALDFQTITHPDDVQADVILASQVLVGSLPRYELEKRYLRKDGSVVHVELTVSLVRHGDGTPRHFVAHIRDVTAARAAAVALAQAEAAEARAEMRYRTALETAPMGVAECDLDGRFVSVNSALGDMFGRSPMSMLGRRTFEFVHPEDLAETRALYERLRDGDHSSWTAKRRWLHADGRWLTLVSHGTVLTDLGDQVRRVLLYVTDVTETVIQLDELAARAETDPLTGVLNRTGLDLLADELAVTNRRVTVLFVDLDRFKPVNDRFGHDVGDLVLRAAADRVRRLLRLRDTVARVGGDEFVVVLQDAPGVVARTLATRIERAMSTPIRIAGGEARIGASVGSASGPARELRSLVVRADEAMYRRKEQRRSMAWPSSTS